MRVGFTRYAVILMAWIASSSVQAITLYRSNSLELHTLDVAGKSSNEHPVTFVDPDSLAQLLASLQLESDEAGDTIYLMAENQAIKAGAELATALARIDRDRDVHLVAFRNVGSFPATRRLASAVRVFVEGGRLNMIFGQLDFFVNEFREPFTKLAQPGKRETQALLGGRIKPAAWFEFKAGRSDWILFPIDRAQSPRRNLRLGSTQGSPVAAEESAPTEIRDAPAVPMPANGTSAVPATSSHAVKTSRWQDLEEGLETLQRLNQKGLITDQEYEAKRTNLLDAVGL